MNKSLKFTIKNFTEISLHAGQKNWFNMSMICIKYMGAKVDFCDFQYRGAHKRIIVKPGTYI